MSSNVVALKGNSAIQGIIPASIEDVWRVAQYVSKSGLAPQGMREPEQCAVAIMHGLEIGLPPMQAVQRIAVINGRPSIWGDAIPALLLSRGFKIDEKEMVRANTVGEVNGFQCTITRPDGTEIVRKFTEGDAKQAKLWGKSGPWQQYPKRMLQMRARALAARDGAADVLSGLYLVEEVQDIDEPPIDITPSEDEAQPEPQEPTEIDELLSHPCFEPSDDRPNANHYKTKEGGGETWTEVISAVNDVESVEKLKQLPDLYADEIGGMPFDWSCRVRDDIKSRYGDLTS